MFRLLKSEIPDINERPPAKLLVFRLLLAIAIIAHLNGCVSITYRQTSRVSELPISAYSAVCFEQVPEVVMPVIDTSLATIGLRNVGISEARASSEEIQAQTLKGIWELVGRTSRPIGYSQTVKVTLIDPFGRGFVYEGIGEHMGDVNNDDLIGATRAALDGLAQLPKFDPAHAKANRPVGKLVNPWPKEESPRLVVLPILGLGQKRSSGSFGTLPIIGGSGEEYEIEAASDDEVFVINGEIFKAKTWCMYWEEGETVLFLEGDPNGSCMDAELFNLNRREKCEVWCE